MNNSTKIDNEILGLCGSTDDFGYVKFEDDTAPLYKMVKISTVIEWFSEFETSIETFTDIGFDEYNGLHVINYQPLANFAIFGKLYDFIHLFKMPLFESIDEEVNFITLLCKLATKDKLNSIMERVCFNPYTWLALMKMNFDAKNFFSERVKILASFFSLQLSGSDNHVPILNYYGLSWTHRSNKLNVSSMSQIVSSSKSRESMWESFDGLQIVVLCDKNKFAHKLVALNDKVIVLFDKHPYVPPPTFKGPTGATGPSAMGPTGAIGYAGCADPVERLADGDPQAYYGGTSDATTFVTGTKNICVGPNYFGNPGTLSLAYDEVIVYLLDSAFVYTIKRDPVTFGRIF